MAIDKQCSECVNWSREVCIDSDGNSVKREAKLATEPFWYYESCTKNWGLPQSAFMDGNKCKFWRK